MALPKSKAQFRENLERQSSLKGGSLSEQEIDKLVSSFRPQGNNPAEGTQNQGETLNETVETPTSPDVEGNEPVVIDAEDVPKITQADTEPITDNRDFVDASFEKARNEALQDIESSELRLQQTREDVEEGESEILNLVSELSGEEQFLQEKEREFGINSINSQIRDIDAQIAQKKASLQAGLTDIEGKPIARPFVVGQQREIQQQAVAEINMLQSQKAFLQNDLATANERVENAVSAKFDPIRAELEAEKFLLQRNDSKFSRQQKQLAEKREKEIEAEEEEIEAEEKDQKQASELALEALNKGADPNAVSGVLRKITKGEIDKAGVISELGEVFGTTSEETTFRKLDNGNTVLVNSQTGDIIKNLGGREVDVSSKTKDDMDFITTKHGYGTKEYFLEFMKTTKGGKPLTQSEIEQITQMERAFNGLSNLTEQLDLGSISRKEVKKIWGTGRIKGRIRNLKQKLLGDAEVAEINATIQGLIPTVARGIFGEVGVLTDVDIENYKKTLPSIVNTHGEAVAISLVLNDVLSKSMGSYLEILGAGGRDVSEFTPKYSYLSNQMEELQYELNGISDDDLADYENI